MAKDAAARETVFALRRQIAKIEGSLPEPLRAPADADDAAVRRYGVGAGNAALPTGVERLDAALGGGLPRAALIEIHGTETRDAGAVAGFMLALVSLILKRQADLGAPVLWIGTTGMFGETGFPHARGLQAMFGIEPETLLFCEAKKLTDALWIAEEAARLAAPAAVVLEVHGNPQRLDLTATRRLHARAQQTGRPLFLLRHAAEAEPTAAPMRLLVAPAASALRETIGAPLAGSIGRPAFTVAIGKSRTALPGQFILEWNPDERIFEERRDEEKRSADSQPVVSLSRHGTDPAAAPGTVLAFRQDTGGPADEWEAGQPAAGGPPSRPQRPAHRRARQAG
ncbi:ImuA family protein [Mesorhizobium sp. A556]